MNRVFISKLFKGRKNQSTSSISPSNPQQKRVEKSQNRLLNKFGYIYRRTSWRSIAATSSSKNLHPSLHAHSTYTYIIRVPAESERDAASSAADGRADSQPHLCLLSLMRYECDILTLRLFTSCLPPRAPAILILKAATDISTARVYGTLN
jgi:hypothetical protein